MELSRDPVAPSSVSPALPRVPLALPRDALVARMIPRPRTGRGFLLLLVTLVAMRDETPLSHGEVQLSLDPVELSLGTV